MDEHLKRLLDNALESLEDRDYIELERIAGMILEILNHE